MLFSFLFVVFLASGALGQAPGDYDPLCRAAGRSYLTNWRVLVDTNNYQNLYDPFNFPSPHWIIRSFDGDSLTWDQASALGQMRSCRYQGGPQDNWLFSQYISYEEANEIFFDVSYRFAECQQQQSAGCTRDYVTVYSYSRNGVASANQRVDTSNYQPLFGTAASSRLQQSPNTASTQMETLAFTRPTSNDGLYLGLRDEGTCGSVIRIIMYYVVCPGRTVDLVTYPEAAVPVRASSDIVFEAVCAPNSHAATTLEVVASHSTSTCTDRATAGAACECDDGGYVLSGNGESCVGKFWLEHSQVHS